MTTFGNINLSGYGGSLIKCVGCVSINVCFYVSTGILVGCSVSSIMGVTVLDKYFGFIPSSCTEDGTSLMIKGSTTFPDRKWISLQGTGVME